jgi:hypothetical protein
MAQQPEKVRAQATMATIHTSKGDIVRQMTGPRPRARDCLLTRWRQHLKLFPDIAPKTVENFVTHIKNGESTASTLSRDRLTHAVVGYYNNLIFHRVIRKFVSRIDACQATCGIFSMKHGV